MCVSSGVCAWYSSMQCWDGKVTQEGREREKLPPFCLTFWVTYYCCLVFRYRNVCVQVFICPSSSFLPSVLEVACSFHLHLREGNGGEKEERNAKRKASIYGEKRVQNKHNKIIEREEGR